MSRKKEQVAARFRYKGEHPGYLAVGFTTLRFIEPDAVFEIADDEDAQSYRRVPDLYEEIGGADPSPDFAAPDYETVPSDQLEESA